MQVAATGSEVAKIEIQIPMGAATGEIIHVVAKMLGNITQCHKNGNKKFYCVVI